MITGSIDHSIRVWDLVTSQCLLTLLGHFKPVNCLKMLHTGGLARRLASGSYDRTLKIWCLMKGVCLFTYSIFCSPLCLAQLSSGELLVGSYNRHIRLVEPELSPATCNFACLTNQFKIVVNEKWQQVFQIKFEYNQRVDILKKLIWDFHESLFLAGGPYSDFRDYCISVKHLITKTN